VWRQQALGGVGFALVLLPALPFGAEAATKKRKKAARAPRPAPPAARGTTLEERVGSLANHTLAVNSTASVEVREVRTGALIAERGSTSPIAPASNLKLFTTLAALDLLGDDFEYKTTLSYRGRIDAGGTLRGDLKVTGRGDPTIGGRFHDGNSVAVFEQWADELKRAGIPAADGA